MSSRPIDILQTPRLNIEPIRAAHAADLFALLSDPELYRFIPQEPPVSLEWLVARYARLESGTSPDGAEAWLNWAVQLRDSGQWIGVLQATVKADGVAFIAYEIGTDFQRRGYALEGCRAMCEYLLARLGVREVRATIDSENIASQRLLLRLGFSLVGTRKAAEHFKGRVSDELDFVWRA
jgi:RimJ/RimL family protein N-acetyltransferase